MYRDFFFFLGGGQRHGPPLSMFGFITGCGDSARSGVEIRSHRTWKCVVDITLKVITDENSIELSSTLGVIG